MLNIVILEGHAVNPGDLSWDAYREFGEVTVYDRTAAEEVIERSKDADVLIVNKTKLNEDVISRLPKLKLILEAATGYDNIDVAATKRHGIPVCNVPGYARDAVAQMVVAMILDSCSKVGYYADAVRKGEWSSSRDFSFLTLPINELSGLSLAIVGFGSIGSQVANYLQPFGMKIYAVTHRSAAQLPEYVKPIALEEAFRSCDFVSLNCPLNEDNRGFVNSSLLETCKAGLILINTARGGLVDDEAVCAALEMRRLGAYYADVLSEEPPRASHPLLSAPNAFITPHIAWATTTARQRLIDAHLANLRDFVAGQLKNTVN